MATDPLPFAPGAAPRVSSYLRFIADATGTSLLHCDAELRFLFVNRAYAERFGLTPEDVVGQRLDEFLGEEAYEAARPYIERVLTGETLQFEVEVPYHALGRRYVHCACTPDRDEAGRVVGWVASILDMTDRHRLERELRGSEERFRTLANMIPQLLWINTPDGITQYYNDRFYEYTGMDPAQGLGTRWLGLIHPDDLERLRAVRSRAMENEQPYEFEYRLRQSADEYRWHICRVVPFRNADGQIEAWFGTATDIHDLKEADRRKDEFLATLAHELRNPLAPIRNALQILHLKAAPDPEAHWARGIVDRQVEQLTRLVDDLLDVSRITRGTVELRRERLEAAAILERALETSRPLIESAGHRLTVTLAEEPLVLEADATRMAQVVSNLLNNACKFTSPGGHIQLSAGREDGQAVIRVVDDGIGIPAEMQSRVFEMFAQVDTSLERAQGGLGIGLTIARRLVEMHGGTLGVRSGGPGEGSELTIRLPLAPEAAVEPAARERGGEESGPRPGLRILVVDDNQDSADSLALWMEIVGHEVRTAHDGPSALAAAEQHFDVILLDIGMPGMSGYEVARRLRERPEGRCTMLVALTGWGQEEDRRRSKEAGFDHHLTKPLDPKELDVLLARARAAVE
jgi:two-component system CheB/CheR fusion protein